MKNKLTFQLKRKGLAFQQDNLFFRNVILPQNNFFVQHIFLCFLFLCGCSTVFSQITFQKQIPVTGFYIESYADGSLLTGGYADSCARLCKINAQGDILWALQSCPTILAIQHYAPYIALSPNQDAWVISRKQVTATTQRSYFNRFDPNGNLLWSRMFSTQADEFGGIFWNHLSVDTEGNLWSVSSYYEQAIHRLAIFRVDAATNTLWQKEITVPPVNGHGAQLYGVFAASADDIFVFGSMTSPLGSSEANDGFVICFDRYGQVKWLKRYDTMQIDQIRSQFSNGDLLVSSSAFSNYLTLSRMRLDGSLVWVKKKLHASNGHILATPYVSWDKQSIWLIANWNYKSETQQDTVMLYKLDEAGMVRWGKGFWNCKYNFVYGGASTPDNGFALLWKHPQGTILTKINAEGQLNNGCPEPQGSTFDWTTPTINITSFSVDVTDGNLPAAEVFEWESVTVSSQDFCPDERPEAFFEAPDSVCTGVPLYLTADSTSLADTYIWNVPAGTPSQSSGINDTLSFLQKGLHNIALIQQYGFCSDTFQRDVQAIGLSSPNLADTVFCNSNPFSVDVTNTDAISYLWNDGNDMPTRLFSEPGLYAVTISDGACMQHDSFRLHYFTAPNLFLSPDTTVCEEATFIPSILLNEVSAWRWDGQVTDPPFAFGNMNGLRILEVLFNNGCVATDSINVQIVDCSDDAPVYIPNAISPQGNSANRSFEIFAPNVIPVQSAIYDRWGELLYRTSAGEWPQWDGTFRGRRVPAGVYLFVCELRFLDGSKRTFTRDITVVY